MARLSDIVRQGEIALSDAERRERERMRAAARETGEQGADDDRPFSSLPRSEAPPALGMRDFPILSQIHNEVGTMASVVDQINRISDYIEAQSGGTVPARSPTPPRAAAPRPESGPAPRRSAQPTPSPKPASSPPSPQPPPAAAASASSPVADPASDQQALERYASLYAFVETVTESIQNDRPFTVDEAFVLIPQIVDAPGTTDVLYRKAIYTRESGDTHGFASAVVMHSVNVCVYALKIGEGLKYQREQLIDLGVGALLHDVGMVKLPETFFAKGRLSPEDLDRLQQHPLDGHAILSALGEEYAWLAQVALQEHERYDGSGYPNGLKGNQIHDYALIIGVADFYAGLTRSRPERRGLLPFEAVKEIIQTHKQKFDPRIVRVLLTKLSAFPIGSLVKLNSGASGRVVATDESSPLRPDIRILYDAQGRTVNEDRVIHLREYPILHITDAIYEEDLRGR